MYFVTSLDTCTNDDSVCPHSCMTMQNIMKIRLSKYIENFTTKNLKFSDKNADIFHISAQNIDSGYSLELPH